MKRSEAVAKILVTIANTKLKIKLSHEMNMKKLDRIKNNNKE